MSIIDTLITDRTQADVNRALTLSAKGWAAMTAAEREEFEAGMKGAYNATDLNRVNAAMEYLDTRLKAMGYTGGYYQRVKVPHQQSGGGSVLPEGYTQVEYIQSDGNQYVDTGFKPNQDTRVVMDAQVISSQTTEGHLFSVTDTNFFTMFLTPNQNEWYRCRYGSQAVQRFPADQNNYDRHIFDRDKNHVSIDGTSVSFSEENFQLAYNLTIFCRNASGIYNGFVSAKIYSCQLYDNGTLIRDYIPCINPGGEVGLYDTVDGLFYGNEGTGAFIAGPQIVSLPAGYKQLEYIKSSGVQWIETGVDPDQDTVLSIDMQLNSDVTADCYPFAVYGTTNRFFVKFTNNLYQGGLATTWFRTTGYSGDAHARLTLTLGAGDFTVGGSTQHLTDSAFTVGATLPLFAQKNNGEVSGFTEMTVYSCKIDGIRNYIPCEAPDGDIGLYDLVTKEFYGNAGTSAFIAGPEVEAPQLDEPTEELDPYTWYKEDIPTPETMEGYLGNVQRLRDALGVIPTTPEVPDSMEYSTIQEWNDIETILIDVEKVIDALSSVFQRAGMPWAVAGNNFYFRN